MENLNTQAERLLNRLTQVAKNEPTRRLTARDLSMRIPAKASKIPDLIKHLRQMGHTVCSEGDAYWYSESKRDLEATAETLEKEAVTLQNTAKTLRTKIK